MSSSGGFRSFSHHVRQVMFGCLCIILVITITAVIPAYSAEPGVTDKAIRIGSTLPLQGDIANTGISIERGMKAALDGKEMLGHRPELIAVNDFYNPMNTPEAVKQLLDKGIFVMLGSFGTPTAKVALPMLAEAKIPAIGFTTGAGFTEPGDILNVRANYAQEVAAATDAALRAGVKPSEICAFAQNDSYGMSGLQGVVTALEKAPETSELVATYRQILNVEGDNPQRNNLGPVGVYQRGTSAARDAYLSLKEWEKRSGTTCRFVATVGLANSTAQFIGYSRLKGDHWIFSVPSPALGTGFTEALSGFKVTDHILGTQVVPPDNSDLPVVVEARSALKDDLNSYSLEGYLIGKTFLAVMYNLKGEISRANFLKAARSQVYDLGGFTVDYTNDNQGSNFVQLLYLDQGIFQPIGHVDLHKVFASS